MPRRNRVDPWGDLTAVAARGTFTGNRGCLVDDAGQIVRHHRGSLWITCLLRYRGWHHPLDAPRTWTPLFFFDDAVALAAGHRPCGLCRREDYLAYRHAVTVAEGAESPILARELNRRLASERLRRGRGLRRASDRILSTDLLANLPVGTVVLAGVEHSPHLVTAAHLQPFDWSGWGTPIDRSVNATVEVLTPLTSIAALKRGFVPRLHNSAML